MVETFNHTIRKVSPDRVVTTLAGLTGSPGSVDGIGNAARFVFPAGIGVDKAGNLYLTDAYNNKV